MLPLLVAVLTGITVLPAGAQVSGPPKTGPKTPPDRPAISPPSPPRSRLQPQGVVYLFDAAPDFELDGSRGKSVKLSSLRGDKVLLIFAPYKERFSVFQEYVGELEQDGIKLVGVCGDKQHSLVAMAQRDSVRFLMLGDVTRDVAAMYGLLDPVTNTIRPGMFLLDHRGVVRLMVLGQVPEPRIAVTMAISALPSP
jgi:peroxiredoxin